MSFMFNPNGYEEPTAVNDVVLSNETIADLTKGVDKSAEKIMKTVLAAGKNQVVAFDGYPSAEFGPIVNKLNGMLLMSGKTVRIIRAADFYIPAAELEKKFEDYLPMDREKDPVLLFGKRFEEGYAGIYSTLGYKELLKELQERTADVTIVFGFGCTFSEELRSAEDFIVYLDVIPKEVVLRAKAGLMVNIGDQVAKPFKLMMRRAYYVDFDISLLLRRELMKKGLVDFYIDSTFDYRMLSKKAYKELLDQLAKQPFRTSPVYLEGVWGGQYVKNLRNVPDSAMKNIAWVFDFIPMEVSVRVNIADTTMSFPFYTFLQNEEESILGKLPAKKFDGFFPIRFNYDDTFHSSGNMSIQVHSGAEYNKKNYGEFGRQDESYYIVVAGHGAKTYLGFNDDIDPDEFLALAKKSEKDHTEIDYNKYINAVESKPGVQVMIPAGTIHASGQNQLILEIGSLTVGSYTYKLYDYLRLDLDGVPRPIHTYHGMNVIRKERNTTWINNNVVQAPRVIREGKDWSEEIIGEHDLLYFSLRHLKFEKEIEDDTNGKFRVLSLVNGEKVEIQSVEHPEIKYVQNYLDIIVIPASMGKYRIKNLTNCPVVIHKTCLKDGFEND